MSKAELPAPHPPTWDELADRAGLTPNQRVECAADRDLAATLLEHALSNGRVRQPAAYALTKFRKELGRRRAREHNDALDLAAGPPSDAVIEQVIGSATLRPMLGPTLAAALRFHGLPVPEALRDE